MLKSNTQLKFPEDLLSYWDLWLVFLAIITLPLEIFLFMPIIILVIVFISLRLQFHNISFVINEDRLTINSGVFTKSQNSIPYDTVQNINLVSGIIMRRFNLIRLEIWTSSPAQIQILRNGERGYRTEHRPEGTLWLSQEDAEVLKKFILDHKVVKVVPQQVDIPA